MKRRLEWLGHLARMQDHRLPRYACLDGYLKHDHAEVQEGGGERPGEERSAGSRDM